MRNYDKITIVCYPRGAGGKFLINCLSLTDQAVFQRNDLAKLQLQSKFGVDEKLNYLHTALDEANNKQAWNDLALGCMWLYGFHNDLYLKNHPEILEKKFYSIVHESIAKEKYLFIVAHRIQDLEAYLKFWRNARVIFLSDYNEFVNQHGRAQLTTDYEKLNLYWKQIRAEHWPLFPPVTYGDFLKLSSEIRAMLTKKHHSEILQWLDLTDLRNELFDRDVETYCNSLGQKSFVWNVANTYNGDTDKLLTELDRCADWLGLTIAAGDADIVKYYQNWRSVLEIITYANIK
jgi:hypothetical protein